MTATDAPTPVAERSKRDQKTHERNLSRVQARVNVEHARADFAATLNALEDKLNVPKQVSRASARTKVKLRRFAKEQPAAAVAAAAGVAVAVGGVVWLIVRNVTRP
ncbi:DUF3618 domain-containing protein [Agromyces aerolatus]|uniref:DUF3618 domain-containing protein n=1 Tax=Agromyces sp. LY-1074 TaxID=3074080 RepID=UPI002854A74C|nr:MULTISPECIES: DUF3618 domain-containing protein [unclassified Agromyces]MDR5701629.1 DUF3618 domain-containing protein [Agromyces sp. LY-1074]MDR5707931.1 DUF3618 domain-containing protein [Agromyces sp. LY-1358]